MVAPDRAAAALRRGRALQGAGRRRAARRGRSLALLVQPVRDRERRRADRRPAARRLHLLGLGERRQPQRGDRGIGDRAGPRRACSAPCSCSSPTSASPPRWSPGRASRARQKFDDNEGDPLHLRDRRARRPARQPRPARGRRLGARLDPDDDPARRPHLALDGPRRGDAGGARRGQLALLHAGRLDRRRSASSPSSGTCPRS